MQDGGAVSEDKEDKIIDIHEHGDEK
jgi:hypothetical protein